MNVEAVKDMIGAYALALEGLIENMERVDEFDLAFLQDYFPDFASVASDVARRGEEVRYLENVWANSPSA